MHQRGRRNIRIGRMGTVVWTRTRVRVVWVNVTQIFAHRPPPNEKLPQVIKHYIWRFLWEWDSDDVTCTAVLAPPWKLPKSHKRLVLPIRVLSKREIHRFRKCMNLVTISSSLAKTMICLQQRSALWSVLARIQTFTFSKAPHSKMQLSSLLKYQRTLNSGQKRASQSS